MCASCHGARFLIMESYDPEDLMDNWKRHYAPGDTTMPFNFYLLEAMTSDCGGHCVKDAVEKVARATSGSIRDNCMNWVVSDTRNVLQKFQL